MKAQTKAPKTTAKKSNEKASGLKLPLAVYLRYRYRLAVKANNLGKAKGLANKLAKMEEPLVVKGETFTTNAAALKFQDSLTTKAPKGAKVAKATKPTAKAVGTKASIKDIIVEIMALDIAMEDKAKLISNLL